MRDYQYGFIDGLVYALNLEHLTPEEARKIIEGKIREIETEL